MRDYDDFERYDVVMFPLFQTTGVGEELSRVDVFRISPADATSIVDEAALGRRKLAGTALGNFGAFLDEGWRENDVLWGRLDGAERIISALVPNVEPARQARRRRPQGDPRRGVRRGRLQVAEGAGEVDTT